MGVRSEFSQASSLMLMESVDSVMTFYSSFRSKRSLCTDTSIAEHPTTRNNAQAISNRFALTSSTCSFGVKNTHDRRDAKRRLLSRSSIPFIPLLRKDTCLYLVSPSLLCFVHHILLVAVSIASTASVSIYSLLHHRPFQSYST
jgi:hypothetical protein